ncbi:Exonuclease 1 [Aphelenchoides bicaudatus]|nr:Exonuclease 1 [Aphelenchoides bicaudatus]
MGIKNLLPFVEKATRNGHISQFEGQRVAIDVSCLLHRGIFGCIDKAARGIKTDFCIKYVTKYINLFLYYRCQVTLVFDGEPLPAKKEVNDSRQERRTSNKDLGQRLLEAGMTDEAMNVFRQGIGVPKEIVKEAIKHFSAMKNINVIVAPYEADAQLAYLIQEKFVDAIVTQDSDLIVFGCQKVIFKLEVNGECKVFDGAKLKNCFTRPLCDKFDFTVFRRMCILAGCDYFPGLTGVGLKKAEKFFARTVLTDPKKFYLVLHVWFLPKVPGFLNLKNARIEKDFVDAYTRAENTFLYQIVYDPKLKVHLPLTPYPLTTKEHFLNVTKHILQISKHYWYAGVLDDTTCMAVEPQLITLE